MFTPIYLTTVFTIKRYDPVKGRYTTYRGEYDNKEEAFAELERIQRTTFGDFQVFEEVYDNQDCLMFSWKKFI